MHNNFLLSPISDLDKSVFYQQGYLVLRSFASRERLEALRSIARDWLANPTHPYELEADVGYPGAPLSREKTGGKTTRRILQAYNRDSVIRDWCENESLHQILRSLLGGSKLFLTQAHHNCLMTKAPHFSSDTGWHQDLRYWSFNNGELISAWLALGQERFNNGGLQVIPGSHRVQHEAHLFDEKSFFKEDLAANQPIIDKAVNVELEEGDVLLFHAKLLHRALRNNTDTTKLSLVFTFHNENTKATPGTRSDLKPTIAL